MTPVSSSAAQRADQNEPERLASWYTPGLSDGVGDRLLMFDNSTSSGLELLRFRREDGTAPGFEEALRRRVEALAGFEHPAIAKVRAVELLSEEDGLALISNHVTGRRLSEILREAHGPQFAAELVRQLVPVLEALQSHGTGFAHGLLTPERIVVTPEGRLVLTEHVLGAAFDALGLSRDQIKIDLGLVIPPDAQRIRLDDPRGDVVQLGYLALSLLIGERVRSFETPQEVMGLVDRQAIAAGGRAPVHLQKWLVRALQVDRTPFASASDAHRALAEWPDHELGAQSAPQKSAPRQISKQASATDHPFLPEGAEVRVAAPATPLPIEDPWADGAPTPLPVMSRAATARVLNLSSDPPPAAAPVVPAAAPPAAAAPVPVTAPAPAPAPVATPAPAPQPAASVPATPAAAAHAPAAAPVPEPAPMPAPVPEPRHASPAPAREAAANASPWLRSDSRFGPMPSPAAASSMPAATTASMPMPAAAPPLRTLGGARIGPFANLTDEPSELETAEPHALVTARKRTHLLQRLVAGLGFVSLVEALIILGLLASRDAGPEPTVDAAPATVTAAATGSSAAQTPGAAAPATLPPAARAEGRLDVTTDPPGARVTVNGRVLGTTPLSASLPPGQHMVIISSGADTTRRTVNVSAGQTAAIVETLQPARANGWVTIDTPLDLQVYRGDLLIGTTRADRLMLPPGRHELRIASEALDYQTTLTVNVSAGETATVRLPIPNGSLSLNAQPWANVWVNGQALGRTPFSNLSLPIGTHEIIWRHPQLGERRQTIVLTARSPVQLSVDLSR